MRWRSWWKQESKSSNRSTDWITWWSTSIEIIWRDKKELNHWTLQSKIRKRPSRSEMTAHFVKIKLEKPLKMKVKIKMNWRCATPFTFKWPGLITIKSAWTEKWNTTLKQNKLFKRCVHALATQMLKKWWWNSLLVSRPTISFYNLLVITRKSMKS